MIITLLTFYVLSVIGCGWAAWHTRKQKIPDYGTVIFAIFCTLVPVVNFICIVVLLEINDWLSKPINWK